MMTSIEPSFKGAPVLIASLSSPTVRPPNLIETLLQNKKVLESEIRFVETRPEPIAIRYLLGRALTRYAIEKVSFKSSQNSDIVQSKSGKPYLAFENGKRRGCFSISHCDQEIVVAVSESIEIGVDIEKTRNVSNAAIAHLKRARTCDWLENNPFSKEENFLIHWVMYEAYVKAMGCGVTLPFQSVKFSPLFDEGRLISMLDDGQKMAPKYVGAFASHCSAITGDSDSVTKLFQFGPRHWLALSERIFEHSTVMDAPNCDVRQINFQDFLGSQTFGDVQ